MHNVIQYEYIFSVGIHSYLPQASRITINNIPVKKMTPLSRHKQHVFLHSMHNLILKHVLIEAINQRQGPWHSQQPNTVVGRRFPLRLSAFSLTSTTIPLSCPSTREDANDYHTTADYLKRGKSLSVFYSSVIRDTVM